MKVKFLSMRSILVLLKSNGCTCRGTLKQSMKRVIDFLSAWIERSSGIFCRALRPCRNRKSRDAESGATWITFNKSGTRRIPRGISRASKVHRSPPEGKLEASDSLLTRLLPEKVMMASPCSLISRKASCFSAVRPSLVETNEYSE